MMDRDNDTDRRFRDLIRAEYGDVAGTHESDGAGPPPSSSAQRRTPLRPPVPGPKEYFNLSEAVGRAEPDDDYERWNPPVDAGLGHLPRRAMAGGVFVAIGLLFGAAVMAGVRLPLVGGIAMVMCVGVGVALLLSTLRRGTGDGDGAQL